MFFEEIFYWDGYHYTTSFATILALNLLIIIAIIFGVAILLKLIVFLMRLKRKKAVHQQPVQEKSYLPVKGSSQQNLTQKPQKTLGDKVYLWTIRILDTIATIAIVVDIALVCIIPCGFYGFHLLSAAKTVVSILFFQIICIIIYVLIETLKIKEKQDDQGRNNRKSFGTKVKLVLNKHKIAIGFMIAGTIFVTVFFPIFFRDSCLCMYNKDYGVLISNTNSEVFSTRLTRGARLDTACPEGAPCHVYATLPSATSTAVFINAHTHYDVDSITLNYDTQTYYNANSQTTRYTVNSDSDPTLSSAGSVEKLDIEDKGKRAIHTILLNGLTPETVYYFEIVYGGTKQFSSTYKTLPASGSTSTVSLAIGGDVGASGNGADMISGLSATNPDLIIVGGDTAYDDGLQSCWYSWDMYLDGFDAYFDKIGRVIPMITSVGNHDVGFNAYSDTSLKTEEMPLYFYYLPQHFRTDPSTGADQVQVPGLMERKTYFYHLIGNIMQVSLDSGYVATYPDQATWMNNLLGSYTSYSKFANYHVPIYPYCFEEDEDETNNAAQRVVAQDNFVPVFQNFGFKAIFEHHVHLFKKSLPLTDGIVDNTNGIVYFGDGNWGVTPNDCITTGTLNTAIQETGSNERHMWILKLIGSTSYDIYPVDITGNRFYAITTGTL